MSTASQNLRIDRVLQSCDPLTVCQQIQWDNSEWDTLHRLPLWAKGRYRSGLKARPLISSLFSFTERWKTLNMTAWLLSGDVSFVCAELTQGTKEQMSKTQRRKWGLFLYVQTHILSMQLIISSSEHSKTSWNSSVANVRGSQQQGVKGSKYQHLDNRLLLLG